jgi:hypothetical protein
MCFLLGLIAASSSDSQLPSISELEKLTFTMGAGRAGGPPPFSEASEMKALFVAYAAQSKALAKYRDPILTRGAQGEAIFRSVSPSVVVVVVGSENKNNKFDPEGLGTGAIVDGRCCRTRRRSCQRTFWLYCSYQIFRIPDGSFAP